MDAMEQMPRSRVVIPSAALYTGEDIVLPTTEEKVKPHHNSKCILNFPRRLLCRKRKEARMNSVKQVSSFLAVC